MVWKTASSRVVTLLVAGLYLLLGLSVVWAAADETSTLFVYLETPADYAVPTEFSLAELSLSAAGQTTVLNPRLRYFAASDLAGRQVLLARAEVAPAFYDSLKVILGDATVQAGAASVKPHLPAGGLSLALGAELRPGDAVVVNLVWHPGPAPAADQMFKLDLRRANRAVPPLGALAFVTEAEGDCTLVVDRQAGRVAGAVRVGKSPRGMAFSTQRQKLYIAESDGDGIAVVDALTLQRERTVPLSFGDDPERLAFSPDETNLYVLNPGSRSLAVLATRSMQEINRVSVGDGPRSLAVDPVTGSIYVACEFAGEVQVYGAAGLTRQTSLTLIASPVEIAVAAQPHELFVSSRTQNRLQGIDLSSGRNLRGQSLCGPAGYLAHNPRSRQLFAAIPACREVAVLRPGEGFEFAPLPTGAAPGYMAFDSTFRQLLVLLPDNAELVILEANRGTVEHRVELGGRPYAVLAP